MNFPKETLELIQDTARKAASPQVVADIDPRMVHLAIDGTLHAINVPSPVREHRVYSLDDLVNYASNCPNGSIWHSRSGVCLLIEDYDRRDRVTFALHASEQYDSIVAAADKPLNQADLVKLLRLKLDLPDLAAQFRRLDWAKSDGGRAEIQHGKESLGREILAEIQGVDQLPEEFRVEIPLYQEQGERDQVYLIRIAIDIDTVNRLFLLAPFPGELESAADHHQADIDRRLREGLGEGLGGPDGIEIYYGDP